MAAHRPPEFLTFGRSRAEEVNGESSPGKPDIASPPRHPFFRHSSSWTSFSATLAHYLPTGSHPGREFFSSSSSSSSSPRLQSCFQVHSNGGCLGGARSPPSSLLGEDLNLRRKNGHLSWSPRRSCNVLSHRPRSSSAVPSRSHGFLQPGSLNKKPSRRIHPTYAEAKSSSGSSTPGFPNVIGVLHLVVSLGLILAADKYLKKAFTAAAIKFPSALFGMFCVFSVLIILDVVAPAAAKSLEDFFEPATLFIQRWLPLFYVPSLVVLPLAVRDIPTSAGLKICSIFIGGWLASLCVAAYTALTVRNLVKTEMIAAEPMVKPSPFSTSEIVSWSAVFVSSFSLALVSPTAFGTTALTSLPFLLAATVLGYIVGSGLPSNAKKVFHPIICCAVSADLAAVAFGYFSRSGLDAVLGDYLTKNAANPGAGDILMGFLGSVIISFAFSMFRQRKLVKRHAAEIFSSVVIATIFSLYSTALAGRLIGLDPNLTISILPRCITVALALSIVSLFEGANASLTAAVVVLTGLVGANFVQAVLDKLGFKDPIARGIATASSAHGLGTAALSAKEPEALPFCAIAYALTGIFGSIICSVPAVRQSLIAIAG